MRNGGYVMVQIQINVEQVCVLLAILLRISLALFMIPLFRSVKYPAPIKAATVAALAIMLYPYVGRYVTPLPVTNVGALLGIVLGELLFAALFAFGLQMLFAAFHLAGTMIGFQMGLAIAQVMDPASGDQGAILGSFFNMIIMLLLFITGGHQIILSALVKSFATVPVGGFRLDHLSSLPVIDLAGQAFVLSIQVSAPIVASLLLAQLAMGLIAKFAPQINILIAGFPVTLAIGLFFTGVSLVAWAGAADRFSRVVFRFMLHLVR